MNTLSVVSKETEIDDHDFPANMAVRVLESIVLSWDKDQISAKGKQEVNITQSDSFSSVFKSNTVLKDEEIWT